MQSRIIIKNTEKKKKTILCELSIVHYDVMGKSVIAVGRTEHADTVTCCGKGLYTPVILQPEKFSDKVTF
jgi:hypothetical protein